MQNTNTWEKYSEVQLKDCEKFCKGYMDFLSTCKTERECVSKIVSDIEEAGYLPLDEKIMLDLRPEIRFTQLIWIRLLSCLISVKNR